MTGTSAIRLEKSCRSRAISSSYLMTPGRTDRWSGSTRKCSSILVRPRMRSDGGRDDERFVVWAAPRLRSGGDPPIIRLPAAFALGCCRGGRGSAAEAAAALSPSPVLRWPVPLAKSILARDKGVGEIIFSPAASAAAGSFFLLRNMAGRDALASSVRGQRLGH